MYLLQSEITTCVPRILVKDMLVQGDNKGKRGRWIEKIQEYELDIRPTKLIKGHGLAKILSESNCQALGIKLITKEGRTKVQQNGIKTSKQKTCAKY